MTREQRRKQFTEASVNGIDITAPYAFVDTPDFCIPTPWGDDGPAHDKPHLEGISGEFVLGWTTETPTLIGGSENSNFYQSPDGAFVLPGASIRGATRALLEAMTMARMNHVNCDAWFSERNFSGDDSRWKQAMMRGGFDILRPPPAQPALSAGFLRRKVDGSYEMIPASWMFAPHATLSSMAVPNSLSIKEKYIALGRAAEPTRMSAIPGKPGTEGCLVVSGKEDKATGGKNKEAWFYDLQKTDTFDVPQQDMDRFLYIHSQAVRGEGDETRSALAFWEPFLEEIGALVPVFYINARNPAQNPGLPQGLLMSFARSFKMPFRYSVGDILKNRTASTDDESGPLDFVEALFGHVPLKGTDGPPQPKKPRTAAWRGRVQFGDARQVRGAITAISKPGITGSPRPSFSPYYLRGSEDEAADWSTAGANLAGFKRYPLRGKSQAFPQGTSGNATSQMNFLNAGVSFEGKVRFHNLLPQELGALLYALLWDGPDSPQRHAIGRGKAFGHGQMRAELAKVIWAEHNSARRAADDYGYDLKAQGAALKAAFKAYLLAEYGKHNSAITKFERIPAVDELLAMQDPAHGAGLIARLVYPAQAGAAANPGPNIPAYAQIRKQKKTLPRYPLKIPPQQ